MARLLRRLGGPRGAPGLAAIVASIQSILDTQLGESLSSPALGVVDFADIVHRGGGGGQALAHSIRTAIVRHEPRLRSVAVQLREAGPLCLAFELSAQFTTGSRPDFTTGSRPDFTTGSRPEFVDASVSTPLRLRVELSASGHLQVRA